MPSEPSESSESIESSKPSQPSGSGTVPAIVSSAASASSPDAAEQPGADDTSSCSQQTRGASTLRALRAGSLSAFVLLALAAVLLLVKNHITVDLYPAPTIVHSPYTWLLIGFLGWLLTVVQRSVDHRGAVIAGLVISASLSCAMFTIASIWWRGYRETGTSVLLLLYATAAILAIALAFVLDVILHSLRPEGLTRPGSAADPARWGTPVSGLKRLTRLKGSRRRAPRPTRTHLRTIAIACTPVLVLGLLTFGIHLSTRPTTVVSAQPQEPLPEPPTSIGSQVSWDKEIPGVIEVVSAATGPIVVSRSGITALSPSDGSPLWAYQRAALYNTVVVSPDGRHLAVRIPSPEQVNQPSTTVVLNTLTGDTVLERMSSGEALQLTDSAVLDGDTAFSLADGSQLWRLSGSETDAQGQDDGCGYQGPVGHASFILDCEITRARSIENPWLAHVDIAVAPDTDPTRVTQAENLVLDPFSSRIPIVNGWALQATGTTEDGSGWMAQAVSLDALAGLEDARTIELGATSGVNSRASEASGTLVTYPSYGAGQDLDSVDDDPSITAAQMIFDPRTLTARPASQDSGLGGASLGVVPTNEGETVGGAISLRSGDGSSETTIPLTEGSTYLSPTELVEEIGPPVPMKRSWEHRYPLLALGTPRATILVLDADAGTESPNTLPASMREPSASRVIAVTAEAEGSR